MLTCFPYRLLLSPQVFIFSRSEVAPGVFECWGHFAESWGLKAYVTWMTAVVFVLPSFIITICQVLLVLVHSICDALSLCSLSCHSIGVGYQRNRFCPLVTSMASLMLYLLACVFYVCIITAFDLI